jgi:hypothetical protein
MGLIRYKKTGLRGAVYKQKTRCPHDNPMAFGNSYEEVSESIGVKNSYHVSSQHKIKSMVTVSVCADLYVSKVSTQCVSRCRSSVKAPLKSVICLVTVQSCAAEGSNNICLRVHRMVIIIDVWPIQG